jgi:dipeptidyl aminopeptidase/acylaminoacyl peptidase
VLNLIPLLKSRELVDPDRIAIFGSSRGAMMACIALKTLAQRGSNAIKVASITSGLLDLFMWAKQRSDLNASVYPDLVGATTTSNPAAFRNRSATYWAGLIRVPLLIQHGDADGEVSVQQSKTLYSRMIAAGRVARLIVLPNGDHGLNNYEAGLPETMKWFQRYLARGDENFDYDLHKDAIYKAVAILRPR